MAIIQSLVRKNVVSDLVGDYGHLIVDECHHLSAQSFEQVVRRSKAKFVTGLSATVTRKDGHHPIVFMQCGPVRHRVDARAQAAARPFTHAVHVRPTGFRPSRAPAEDVRIQFQELYSELIADQARNQLICDDVLEAVREGRSPLVLTERNEHLDFLAERLSTGIQHLIVLRGGMGRNESAAVIARLAAIPENEPRALLATGRLIGEGFDDARLDTLFLTLPVSWHGTIAQYAGRLHRLHDRKREVRVMDYADLNVPHAGPHVRSTLPRLRGRGLHDSASRQCRAGMARGRSAARRSAVENATTRPVSADSCATGSTRRWRICSSMWHARLLQPTRESFGLAARPRRFFTAGSETLPETAGRFRLNAELPIPFDGSGRMEVDLLCADARVAIELDGSQHLDGEDAYRRDRRKDLLLQEHGYFVLRFLAADVGRRLDTVLDTILRTLSHRRRG